MPAYVLVTIGAGVRFLAFAHLFVMDLDSGCVVDDFRFRHQVYEQSTKGFTGASLSQDGTLWVTTEAEILQLRLNPLEPMRRVTEPFLNDVHHVCRDAQRDEVLVCNSGLDAVEVFSPELDHIRTVNMARHLRYLPRALSLALVRKPLRQLRDLLKLRRAARPSSAEIWAEDMRYKHLTESIFWVDLRKVLFPHKLYQAGHDLRYVAFRPHIVHPNFVGKVGDDYLVTLHHPGQVVTLEGGEVVRSGLRGPHDGVLRGATYLLTQAGTGLLSFCRSVESVDDLHHAAFQHVQVCDPRRGFLRGVDLCTEDTALVAVSKRRELTDDRPAYLSLIDLSSSRCLKSLAIPLEYGTNPFSVVDVTPYYS
jgi:hypothetical protein